ncbi:hypothetical protein HYV85_00235 [Candidatus Woesearchaeota archaeon]|nr:hypothetical protein [Candidatus Woesearchaeota archaeon]
MSVGKSLFEILNEDSGPAVTDLQSRIIPWNRSVYPTELLKSFYINVPDTMRDVAPVPKSMRFVFDRYGHFFAHHCGLYSESSHLKQLLLGITIDASQYDEKSRQMLRTHGDNHFATLERTVLRYNKEGETTIVVGRMPKWRLSWGSTNFKDSIYIYVESGRFMKPSIVSLINGSNIIREEEPIILCSDLAHEEKERMLGFTDKALIMTPKSLFHTD